MVLSKSVDSKGWVKALVLGFADGFAGLTFGRALVGLSMGAWVLHVVFFGSLFSDEEMIKACSWSSSAARCS
ncbi:MAG: hypothetical protein R6V86_11705 [Spirochaetia bacterium]